MALDGITIAAIVNELKEKLLGGRIDKVFQPEGDELVLLVRSAGSNHRLLLTANASNARAHLTKTTKDNPMQPPQFCMVLRKHLTGGKITGFDQPGFERIINISVESLNELGDLTEKTVVIEIMGKHSNIILLDDKGIVLDSAKRVPHDKSSVREVLPGRQYVMPPSKGKKDPRFADMQEFECLFQQATGGIRIQNWLYESYSGISPVMASELCERSGISPSAAIAEIGDITHLFKSFRAAMDDVVNNKYVCEIIYDEKHAYTEFAAVKMTMLTGERDLFDSPSEMLETYYAGRDARYHILQKSQDLRRLIATNIERLVKKYDIQQKTLKEIENRDKWRLYGELITANIYAVKRGMKELTTINFYNENAQITIALDEHLTPSENAQKYFKRYNKEKRTFEALQTQITQTAEELNYLEGVLNAALAASDESDLDEIREELAAQGFAKRKYVKKGTKRVKKSKPLKYTSADNFEIYVGKSNTQNDELTLRFAAPDDIWLHTKEIPGSHVIIRTEGKIPPDSTIEEAARLAALFSKARDSAIVPVDYTTRRNVKKPNGARPGMVIYNNYKTAFVSPAVL